MTNTAQFISEVYELLRTTFSVNPNSDVLQLSWPGFALSSSDFKLQGNADGPYDPNVAVETFSALCNMAPTMNHLMFENSGCEIDDLYQILIASAIPQGATSENILSNPLYKLFSDAQFEFINAARGSIDGGVSNYYPCKATPNDWYDESNARFWPSFTINSKDPISAQPSPTSTFMKLGGQKLIDRGIFRIRAHSSASEFNTFENNLFMKKNQYKGLFAPPKNSSIKAARTPLVLNSNSALKKTAINNVTFRDHRVVENFKILNASASFDTKALPNNIFESDLGTELKIKDRTFLPPKRSTVGLKRYVTFNQLINQELPTKSDTGNSSGFSISFKCCRVNIDRPWLKYALLNMKNWYMAGTPLGQYSSGVMDPNPGIFPLLPIAFIAIRDLTIEANWSQEDLATIKDAVSFGPFSIENGSITSNKIEVKGLQIMGWISKCTPVLPPLNS